MFLSVLCGNCYNAAPCAYRESDPKPGSCQRLKIAIEAGVFPSCRCAYYSKGRVSPEMASELRIGVSRLIGMHCNGTIAEWTKMRIVEVIIVFLSVVSFCSSSMAEQKTGSEKQENPHVVFSSFLAPGSGSQSKRVNVPVTLVFEVTKGTDTKRFCLMSPRILDAVMRDLHKKPIKMRKNRAINLPVLGARLTSVANGAIKKDTVVTTQVFDKVFTGKSGKTISAYWKKCTAR